MIAYASLSDEEIVKAVRTVDKEAYGELIKRYQNKLLRYTKYLMGNDDEALDVVQRGFIKAYVNLQSFDVKQKFSSWIYRIVHNEAMNVVIKQKHVFLMEDKVDFESGINIEDDLIKKEFVNNANKCLEKMPIIYKEPLSLFFLEEKSYEEISDIIRIPIGTVGTRMNRAKLMMKKICQKQML